jgi:GNAT superfamily N-acetyltransferase
MSNLTSEIHAIAYNHTSEPLRRAIALLQHHAAPEIVPPPDDPVAPEHDPMLEALSFYLAMDGRVVSYAAVVHRQIVHAGTPLRLAGLSCVATDRAYQRRGLGARTVAAATRCIEDSDTDIGIFTCDPPLAYFYERAGGWPIAPDVVLIGSSHPDALNSARLGKAVLMRLLSTRARTMAAALQTATIDLGLPLGQFW